MAVFQRGPPYNGDVECRWDRQKLRSPTSISLNRMLSVLRLSGVINTTTRPWQTHHW